MSDEGLLNSSQQALTAEAWQMAAEEFRDAGRDLSAVITSPNVIYKPRLYVDGSQWCAIYGENLQDGVAGFGDSPSLAMVDFDKSWYQKLPIRKVNR